MAIGVVCAGILIFVEALINNRTFIELFLENPLIVIVFLVVTALLIPLLAQIKKRHKMTSRLIVSAQLFFILLAWCGLAFPHLIHFKTGSLSILEQLPPDSVFSVLGWSLLIAAVFVLPGLYHLFKTFGLTTK